MPTSKETRVRVDAFSKIIARLFPRSGSYGSPALVRFLIFPANSSSPTRSSRTSSIETRSRLAAIRVPSFVRYKTFVQGQRRCAEVSNREGPNRVPWSRAGRRPPSERGRPGRLRHVGGERACDSGPRASCCCSEAASASLDRRWSSCKNHSRGFLRCPKSDATPWSAYRAATRTEAFADFLDASLRGGNSVGWSSLPRSERRYLEISRPARSYLISTRSATLRTPRW